MEKEADNRTLTINKTFNVPLEIVWSAWTNPEHIAKWWSPKGMQTNIIEHDFRVGGKWKYVTPMPDASEFISEGAYKVIVEFEKLVSSANFMPITDGVEIHILFEKDGNKTNFTFSVVHPTEEYCRQQEKMGFYNGWNTAFDRLKNILETQDQ